jgi:hypothetical protein
VCAQLHSGLPSDRGLASIFDDNDTNFHSQAEIVDDARLSNPSWTQEVAETHAVGVAIQDRLAVAEWIEVLKPKMKKKR